MPTLPFWARPPWRDCLNAAVLVVDAGCCIVAAPCLGVVFEMGASQGKVALQEAIVRLHGGPIAATDSFWEQLLSNLCALEDLYSVLTPTVVRALASAQPLNLRILLEISTGYCRNYELSFDTEHKTAGGCATEAAVVNCLQILSRILPFILEPHTDPVVEAQIEALFWAAPVCGAVVQGTSSDGYERLCLARKIMHVSTALLFKDGFGIQPPPSAMGSIINAPGLTGVVPLPNAASANAEHCTAALRCLLTCFCESLYADPSEHAASAELSRHHPGANRWLQWARSSANTFARPLFAALLNTILGDDSDPVGWGMPYGHLLTGPLSYIGGQPQEDRCCVGLHVLLLLLDHAPVSQQDDQLAEVAVSSATARSTTAGPADNIFWSELQNLPNYPHGFRSSTAAPGDGDYAKILKGLERFLGQPGLAERTVLPGSIKPLRCAEEILVLLWHFLEGNVAFRQFASGRARGVTVAVCAFLVRHRKEEAKVGMLHVCVFILLLLSGERSWCVGLNRPIQSTGPPPPAELGLVVGSAAHSDLLIQALSKLLSDGHPQAVVTQADVCMTIICNASPYVKQTSQNSTLDLLALFDRVAKPVVKAAKQTEARPFAGSDQLLLMIETFDNMLQYQSGGNARLTYGLVRRKKFLHKVANGGGDEVATAAAEWHRPVQEKLGAIIRLVDGLYPLIEGFCADCSAEGQGGASEGQIIGFLEDTTLVGLLPVPHPILCRKYLPNVHTVICVLDVLLFVIILFSSFLDDCWCTQGLWFTTFLWGVIYLQHMTPPLFDSAAIKLFHVAFSGDQKQQGQPSSPQAPSSPAPTPTPAPAPAPQRD